MNNAEVLIKFTGDATQAEKATNEVKSSLEDLSKKGELALAGLTAAADAFAISMLKGGIDYNAEMETYLVRLETLTGSAEEANAVLDQIKKDALKTPFDVASLTQAESLLISTGITADDARDDILALGNAVSAVGGTNEQLQRMAVNMMQIKNYGKASALDMKQFSYAGIDMYGLLADSMGITREEAAELDVTYDMLSNALQYASQKGGKYYGAMEKQSKTYAGQMSNLKESIQVMKGEISKGLFKALKKIIPVLEKMFNWIGKNHKVIEAIAVPLLTFVNVFAGYMMIQKFTMGIKALWLVLSANPVGAAIAGITALVAAFIYLWNNCEGFRNFWINLWNGIKVAVKVVIDSIVAIFQSVVTTIQIIWNVIYDYIVTPIMNAWNGIQSIFMTVATWITKNVIDPVASVFNNLWSGIKTAAKGAWNGITSIFSGFANFFKTIFTNAWTGIMNLFKAGGNIFVTIKDGVLNGFKSVVNKLIDGINSVVAIPFNGINNTLKTLKKVNIAGLKPFNWVGTITVPQIPHLNVGTNYVPEDQLAMIHKGEAVIPKKFNPYANGMNLSTFNNRPTQTIIVNANFKQNSLGQTVRDIKTFSGGARNDFNYGVGV